MLLPTTFLENTKNVYLPKLPKNWAWVYILLCIVICAAIASLPYLYVDISINATGIIRPSSERTEIKSSMSGIIDTVWVTEGAFVNKNQHIISIQNPHYHNKTKLLLFQYQQDTQCLHDLHILIQSKFSPKKSALKTALYYEQSQKYFFQLNEIKTQIQKAYKELTINTSLHKDKVISAKELFDVENNFNRLNHTLNAFKNTQIGIWQQEYQRLQLGTSQIFQELQQLHIDNKLFVVKSPVDGIVQGIQNKYAQNSIYPNEVLCSVSPNDNLVAECYINAKDIGLIKLNQKATLQIDAFDYKYFGVLNAVVSYIDNDYNVINNSPVFKVRCNLNQKYLISKLGYKGDIKKGLSLQAKFFIIRRSLWQLLYDKMDNWLNPMNQSTKN